MTFPSFNSNILSSPRKQQRKSSSNNTTSTISSMTLSPRSSIASTSTSKYTSGLTATSTYSSIDEHQSQISTSNSSAIDFLSNSMDDFGIVDDYEDVDDGIIGN
jgi:hypothetical protein